MSLTVPEQVKQLIDQHTHFLLVFPPTDRGDALASALAIRSIILARRKQAEVVSSDYTVPKTMSFLPGAETVQNELHGIHKFIVKVDISHAPVESISYDVKDNWLSIYVTPKSGSLSKQELRTAQTNFKYDAVFVFGAADLEKLGKLFLANTDLFYRTPIINIDSASNNERFGAVNVVDLTSAAVSEATYHLVKHMGIEVNPALATTILAGMTAATKSFTSANVTPKTLAVASELVERGAERERVVEHLYRTRSVGTLKLWGAALQHLSFDHERNLVTTTITRDDFSRTGTDPTALHGLIEELIANTPEAARFILLYENKASDSTTIGGLAATNREHDALQMLAPFSPIGNSHEASFSVTAASLDQALTMVRDAIVKK